MKQDIFILPVWKKEFIFYALNPTRLLSNQKHSMLSHQKLSILSLTQLILNPLFFYPTLIITNVFSKQRLTEPISMNFHQLVMCGLLSKTRIFQPQQTGSMSEVCGQVPQPSSVLEEELHGLKQLTFSMDLMSPIPIFRESLSYILTFFP